jgi:hypothetical protein
MAKSKPTAKASVKKRTLNMANSPQKKGAPFSEQDPKRRLGNFEGKGEPSRKGSRSAGIVGQTKQKFRNDK